jgi:hypothetical protein
MTRRVERITVIHRSGDKREARTVYREEDVDERDDRDWDAPVTRVTVIQHKGDKREASTVYKKGEKGRRKVSIWTRPLERAARRLVKAQIIFGQEVLRRHDEANRRRRDGWLREAPSIIAESSRRAYNEARKAVPFRILPKA